MPVADTIKSLLNRKSLQSIALPPMNALAHLQKGGVQHIFLDDGIWMHQTARGYFAYHQPYLRLDLAQFDAFTRRYFFWGYEPRASDVVIDVGAGVGEETLTFSKAVGERGKVICIEAHPRTYLCLEKLVQYNGLKNVVPIHVAVTKPGCSAVTIGNGNEYLANRLHEAGGISVPAATIDEIHQQLNLGRIHFLKMNIEGSERLAIRGMAATLRQTQVLCVSCHDFLAESGKGEGYRTKNLVREFLLQSGLDVIDREDPGLPPYIRDQIWAYNRRLMQTA